MRPRIKICGLTTPEDALLAVEVGADYLGLNFFPGSPRGIDLDRALEIRAAVGSEALLVGVFVNHESAEIEDLGEALALDLLQFHGDEGPEQIGLFGDRAIKVWRRPDGLSAADLATYPECWGFLCDTFDPRLYGGTGRSWRYDAVLSLETEKPIFVAGGLNPDNIADAARSLPVFGLDICSGVEESPGCKDPRLLRRLFEEIDHAETAS